MDSPAGEIGGLLVAMLAIQDLSVAYGAEIAIQGISLQIRPGEVVGLIGPNGAGKTTLIRAISGLLKQTKGTITLQGENLNQLSTPQRARYLAVVPQARQLGGALTVRHTVLLGRTVYMGWTGRSQPEDEAAVLWAMEQTDLLGLAGRRNAELSGGEQQRVLLARALAQQTPIMLLDEPTNHLDLQHQASFLNLVRRLSREQELAVLIALHDLNLVSRFTDRVALMVGGQIQALGPAAEVLTADRLSAAYGTPVEVIPHPDTRAPLVFPGKVE